MKKVQKLEDETHPTSALYLPVYTPKHYGKFRKDLPHVEVKQKVYFQHDKLTFGIVPE